MLVCENLSIGIQSESSYRTLLQDLTFSASPGEILMIVGKNGTGKSTLLKTLAGFRKLDSGKISLYEKKITQSFAFVVQDNVKGTIKDFTVYENLSFAFNKGKKLSFFRSSNSRKKDICAFLSENAPMFLDRLGQKVSSLSGGQRQLLSIVMNLLNETQVLLLDEPTAALDEDAGLAVMSQLQKWTRERGLITVMVCHDSSLVEKFGDSILALKAEPAHDSIK